MISMSGITFSKHWFRLSENIPGMIGVLNHANDRAWEEFDKADVANGYVVASEN